jgi:RNA polymerase sigma factor (sigma-70 family)
MTELNDQSLLTHWYRHRNAEAFRVLAARHARMVYATALRILRNPHDAEEVSQQSFLALAQTRRPPSGNVAAWLHRTAYRAALNLTRARNRRTARDHTYAAAQPDSVRTEWDDIRDLVDEAVAGLPDAYRECIVLYFFEEQTHAAIGERLGVTRQAAAQRIEKGVALVRKRLASKGVVAPAGAALVAVIHENAVHALPATLMTEMGRISLAATPSVWAVGATYVSGAALKVAAAMLLVGAAGWAIFQVAGHGRGVTTGPVTLAVEESGVVAHGELDSIHPEPQAASLPTTSVAGGTDLPTSLASVAGTVTLPNGRPMSSAKVWIVAAADLATGDNRGSSTFSVDADAQGRFELREIPPGEYGVLVREKENNLMGPDSELARITLSPGDTYADLNLVFGIEGDFTISGTIMDGQGRPLEGVRVTKFGPVSRGALSDALGRFTIRYLPDDGAQLNVDKQGYTPEGVMTRAGDQNVHVVLHQGAAVQGRVIDAKTREPVTNYEAILKRGYSNPAGLQAWEDADRFENPEGEFKFPPIFSGEVTVAVRAPGYALAATHTTVAGGGILQGLLIELHADEGVVRTGRVVTAEGLPIVGARIATGRIVQPGERTRNVVATTDETGEFRAENIPEETVLLYAWHPEFAPASRLAESTEDIVLKKAGRLNVEVLSQGTALSKVTVSAECFGERNIGYRDGAATGEDGRVLLEEIVPGRVLVQAELSFGRVQWAIVSVEPGEEQSVRFEVAPAVAAVEGVVYRDGEPVAGVGVQLAVDTSLGRERQLQDTGPDGTFSFRNVPLGDAQIIASIGGYSQRAFLGGVALESGEVTSLSLDLTAERVLRGTVSGLHRGERGLITVLRGALSHHAAIEAAEDVRHGMEIASHGFVEESGLYELPMVETGIYTLLLSTTPEQGYAAALPRESRVVEVSEGQDSLVDFELHVE